MAMHNRDVGRNRLAREKSPYLLQHADNPVDWYPWGAEAFERARAEDKPVFLSIGYATCHWCHVMERESFEDEEIASLLNRHFVSIKVDREERPDVDHLYMQVTQALTGSGGWPMSVFLTPEKHAFFAGTYFPKTARGAAPGFADLLSRIVELWSAERDRVLDAARRSVESLAALEEGAAGGEVPGAATLEHARRMLGQMYDQTHGGFGNAPKLPAPHMLSFLLRWHHRRGDADALAMVEATLAAMRLGGVYDQIGFGLHRYSTDREWRLPHFEKMLYDQALFALANVETHQVTGKEGYARTAREVFAYVLRDLTSPAGAFYCAEDADSDGEEGAFYLWSPAEVRAVLGPSDAGFFNRIFRIEEGGNFRDPTTGAYTGRSLPSPARSFAAWGAELDVTESELLSRIGEWRAALFVERRKRRRPLLDDKVLTGWNGLMIAALARGGRALGERRYAAAAARAAEFVLERLRDRKGRLLRRFREGEAAGSAVLEDYAFLGWGLLELYEALREPRWLREADRCAEGMLRRFDDPDGGGLYMTAADAEALPARLKEGYDGALPSGNSVAALVFLHLSRLTGRTAYEERGAEILRGFAGEMERSPAGFCQMLTALDFLLGPTREVVIAGDPADKNARTMLATLDHYFLPRTLHLFKSGGAAGEALDKLAPFTADLKTRDGATAYVCENFACREPVTDPKAFARDLLHAAETGSPAPGRG